MRVPAIPLIILMYTETIQEDDTWRWYVETIHLYGALNCGQAEATVIDSCSMFLFIKVKLRLDHFHFNSNCHCLPYWWAWPSLWWWSAASYHLCSGCVGMMSVDVISVVWVRCGVMGVGVVGVVWVWWVWCGCDGCGMCGCVSTGRDSKSILRHVHRRRQHYHSLHIPLVCVYIDCIVSGQPVHTM